METAVIWILAAPVILLLIIALAFKVAESISEFQGELRYINNEIGRTSGKEQKKWMKRRRRLWLSLLPFFRY